MKYLMKSGVLYEEPQNIARAKIHNAMLGPVKEILQSGEPVLKTDIRCPKTGTSGDVRRKEYLLLDEQDHVVAEAHPDYAPGNDPTVSGWPICRMPMVDHAQVTIEGSPYLLTMHNSQNYTMSDTNGSEILRIMHQGLSGGWAVDDTHGFPPAEICGLFTFCRYIERENEFLTV